jgi:hypothetical protein
MTDAACVRCGVRRSAASPHIGAIASPLTLEVPRRRQSEGCRMAGRDRRGSVSGVEARRAGSRSRGSAAAAAARASTFLNCPRCELSAQRKTRLLGIEHCPRWTAPARIPVRLFFSALPTVEMYRESAMPHAEQPGVPTTITSHSQ